jgi:hypothetical protein
LPIHNEKGHYEEATPPLTLSSDVSDFIRDRTAARKEHVRRQQHRRGHGPGPAASSHPPAHPAAHSPAHSHEATPETRHGHHPRS